MKKSWIAAIEIAPSIIALALFFIPLVIAKTFPESFLFHFFKMLVKWGGINLFYGFYVGYTCLVFVCLLVAKMIVRKKIYDVEKGIPK